jgi:hypothetical protein
MLNAVHLHFIHLPSTLYNLRDWHSRQTKHLSLPPKTMYQIRAVETKTCTLNCPFLHIYELLVCGHRFRLQKYVLAFGVSEKNQQKSQTGMFQPSAANGQHLDAPQWSPRDDQAKVRYCAYFPRLPFEAALSISPFVSYLHVAYDSLNV